MFFLLSTNSLFNIGQVEGAFCITGDIPADFRIALLGKSPNPSGVLGGTYIWNNFFIKEIPSFLAEIPLRMLKSARNR
jgi:hypothetical protein